MLKARIRNQDCHYLLIKETIHEKYIKIHIHTYIHQILKYLIFMKNTTIGEGKDMLQHNNSGDFSTVFLSKKKSNTVMLHIFQQMQNSHFLTSAYGTYVRP